MTKSMLTPYLTDPCTCSSAGNFEAKLTSDFCRYTGRKESGFNNNSSYYVLTQCPDGAFEAMPISSWYNFTPDINYQTLTMDEAEEEFSQRHKTINYFARMVKKRLDNKEEEQSESATSTALKTASRAPGLVSFSVHF